MPHAGFRVGVRKAKGAAGPRFSDDFNRANSANALGASWTVYRQGAGSELGILSNKGYCSSSSGGSLTGLHDLGGATDFFDVTVTLGRANTAGGSYFFVGADPSYLPSQGVRLQYDGSAGFSQVQRCIDGTTLTLSGGRGTFLAFTGGTTVIRMTYRRSTGAGSIWQNGVLVGNFTGPTASSSGTTVGFGTNSASAGDTWDDFVVA